MVKEAGAFMEKSKHTPFFMYFAIQSDAKGNVEENVDSVSIDIQRICQTQFLDASV
jgi:hypothetical protein